jgi:hypothetical protein
MSFRYDKVGRRTAIDPRCRNLGTSARAIPSRSEHIQRPDCSVQETTTDIYLSAAMSLHWRSFCESGVWLVFLGSSSKLCGVLAGLRHGVWFGEGSEVPAFDRSEAWGL